MFVDASALMAILRRESDHQRFAEALDGNPELITSPIAVVETIISLTSQTALSIEEAQAAVAELLDRTSTRVVPVDENTGTLALTAHKRFGKRSGHPARLNLGDCFAYAMARQHRVPLLYKGDDFARTDLA